jgi:hypothetical protein
MKTSLLKIIAALLGLVLAAHAQQRALPDLAYVYPAGGQQGTMVTLSIGGQALNNPKQVYVSGLGVQARVLGYERPLTQKEVNDLREKVQELQDKRAAAKADATKPALTLADETLLTEARTKLANRPTRATNPSLGETVTVELTIAADAPPGPRELRVKTASGLSNPLAFAIGLLHETSEPVVTGTMVEPRAGPGKPEPTLTLPTVVNGQILPGEVDRFRFSARQGQRLTIAAAARALRPYLADAVPGWFQATLALYDANGREVAYAGDHRFNPDPVVLCEVPADGDYVIEIKDALLRGREDFVYRITVGELPFVTGIFPLGGHAGGQIKFEVSGWNLPTPNAVLVDTAPDSRGNFLLTLRNPVGLANAMPFAVGELPESVEHEPNDSATTAQPLALPAIINGRIGRAGDVDVYSFDGTAGARIVAEVIARRLESPLDSTLEVTDATGRRLAFNDDFDDKTAGLLTHQSDSRVELTLPADGKYFVRVTDAQRHGGPEFGYRLRVSAPRPDFALRIVPSTINVRAGTSVPVTIYAVRRDGFSGEIALGLRDAPAGFSLGGARIPPQQDKIQLTLTASNASRDEPLALTVVGTATIAGQRVAHVAVPADDLMQAFAYHHLVAAEDLLVDVTGRGPAFRPLAKGPVQIPAGGTARFRIASFAGRALNELRFELAEPIAGLALKTCDVGRDYVEIEIACDAAKIKGHLEGNLLLHAVGERRNAQGAATRVQRNALGFVPAIPFEVVPPDGS